MFLKTNQKRKKKKKKSSGTWEFRVRAWGPGLSPVFPFYTGQFHSLLLTQVSRKLFLQVVFIFHRWLTPESTLMPTSSCTSLLRVLFFASSGAIHQERLDFSIPFDYSTLFKTIWVLCCFSSFILSYFCFCFFFFKTNSLSFSGLFFVILPQRFIFRYFLFSLLLPCLMNLIFFPRLCKH